jgi:beta-lactamase class A
MRAKILYLLLALSIVINVVFLSYLLIGKENIFTSTEKLQEKYPHLSQRILGGFDRDLIIHFIPLRTKLRELVENNYGGDFSIYFEYLPTGTSIGVNEKTEFYSASLLKVPVVMAYYHHKWENKVEGDPTTTILEKDISDRFGALWRKGAGSKIQLSKAVELSLIESDNTAINVVLRYVTKEDLSHIYNGLDILLKKEEGNNASITTKAYASILKALFFSSLLPKEDSEHILDLLTKTKFKDKLPAGLPADIPVAHKISVYENLKVSVYADCGIVYVPKRQYLLCMASRSSDEVARERMRTVSKMVYDFVSTTNNTH